MAPSSQNGSLAVIGLSRLANERTKLASVTTIAEETMADVRCFCLCAVDYQNCSCPDHLIESSLKFRLSLCTGCAMFFHVWSLFLACVGAD